MSDARVSSAAALALALLLDGSGCAQQTGAQDHWANLAPASVEIHNSVESCLKLAGKEIVVHGETVKLVAEAESMRSTAECGCRSALLSYRTYVQRTPEYAETWVTALVSTGTLKAGQKRWMDLMLTSDKSFAFSQDLSIDLGCAPDE